MCPATGPAISRPGWPVEPDTLWRIYSMTKPVTSVAAMMLYEEGAFELTDPVSAFIPSFADVRVYAGGPDLRPVTVPATEPVRIWHLLTHTSGLTYGFLRVHPVDAMYRAAGFEWASPPGMDLAQACDTWAGLPLLFQPGSEWSYSVATDVLGRVIEVVSGQDLDEFFAARILRPLGMTDTSFSVGDDDAGRLAALYTPGADRKAARLDALGDAARERPAMLSGGGGLVSTAADYHRFTQMLLHRTGSPAGELDGIRLLSPRTVGYMARNHLPGGLDLDDLRQVAVRRAPVPRGRLRPGVRRGHRPGGGPAGLLGGRAFLGRGRQYRVLDRPAGGTDCIVLHPAAPSSAYRIRPQLRQLVYQALIG